jgi:hypothetical protein
MKWALAGVAFVAFCALTLYLTLTGVIAPWTDAELEQFLGIARLSEPERAKIMAQVTPEKRALFERMANLVRTRPQLRNRAP